MDESTLIFHRNTNSQPLDQTGGPAGLVSDRRIRKNDEKLKAQIASTLPIHQFDNYRTYVRRDLTVGTWVGFLRQDAAQTRKDFNTWIRNFRLSTEGRKMSKTTKTQIHILENPYRDENQSKALSIENGQLITKIETETQDLANLPQPVVDDSFNTDRIRISRSILKELILGNRTTQSALSAALNKSSIEDPDFVATPATSDTIQQLLAALNLNGDEEEAHGG
ncbi:MAG: hypothetical protein Q9169_005563 [Polycauliona sp. 2 TL-2023]